MPKGERVYIYNNNPRNTSSVPEKLRNLSRTPKHQHARPDSASGGDRPSPGSWRTSPHPRLCQLPSAEKSPTPIGTRRRSPQVRILVSSRGNPAAGGLAARFFRWLLVEASGHPDGMQRPAMVNSYTVQPRSPCAAQQAVGW